MGFVLNTVLLTRIRTILKYNYRMGKYIDQEYWDKHITFKDWYLRLSPELEHLEQLKKELPKEEVEVLKEEVCSYIEDKLESKVIQVNSGGPDWDSERKPIDTIIIHHTSRRGPVKLTRLNAKQMLLLYTPFFTKPSKENAGIKGKAMWSGHFMDGKQVFYAYHWLIRMDGSKERLLDDRYIGWHSGNWDINARSIAVCLDEDLEFTSPDTIVLQSVADLIKANYGTVSAEKILGHREINKNSVCPGNRFLEGWKETLLKLAKK